jgi:predicted DNA-binding antitoxin AbrB/MazE fold protein
MSQEFDAIYENGVLRPLQRVDFREHEVLTVSVTPSLDEISSQAVATKQRDILLAFTAKMEALADEPISDDYTNRDHDRIIYGEDNAVGTISI